MKYLINKQYMIMLAVLGMFVGLAVYVFGFQSQEGFKSNPSEKEIVLFKSEGCGYCKRIKPVWNKLVSEFSGNPYISFREVDVARDDEPLVESLGIEGVPTIYYVKQESPIKEYTGDRSYEDMKLFIEMAIQQ